MCERPHRAGQFADGDLAADLPQPVQVAGDFLIPDGQLEPERDRLAVNAVRAPDHHGVLVPERLLLQHRNESFHALQNQIERLGHLHGERGIDDIR